MSNKTDMFQRILAYGSGLAVVACALTLSAQQQPPQPSLRGSQTPTRDTSAQQNKDTPPTPTGRIMGRVVAADTGRPVKRARVFVSAAELPEGRGGLTDDSGVFDLAELPAGRYSLSVSKSGFVSLSYGQRRPLQAGIPLQLADGQQLKGIDFQLPRGSAIAGRVFDEDGDPMPAVNVRVMRYQYLQGERRLMPAGSSQTDDKGQYRVWGLMPGEYYVSAIARNFGGRGPRGGFGGGFGRPFGPAGGGRGGAVAGQDDDPDSLAYAPTYFPGVPSVNEARAMTLGLSQELLDVNFNMLLVRAARITGHVLNPDGSETSSGNVNMIPEAVAAGGQIGMTFGGRIQWDGEFTVANVPPGRYILRARGDDADVPQFASLTVTVNGQDLDDLTVMLTPGATIAGTVTMLPSASPAPDVTRLRITAPPTDQNAFGPQGNARVDKDGRFTLSGVPAGTHLLRPNGNLGGWTLKSVIIDGRDMTDAPFTVRSGETLSKVDVTFTDRVTEINGTLTDEHGTPVPDFTVLAFTTDTSLWRPLSRHIMTARPDQTGKYRIRGLPPGDYYVVTVDPAQQGEWFEPAYLDDHRAGAAHVSLAEGDTKTQDFHVSIR